MYVYRIGTWGLLFLELILKSLESIFTTFIFGIEIQVGFDISNTFHFIIGIDDEHALLFVYF